MQVIRNTEEIGKVIGSTRTAVALGAFDGLHIGHRAVIRAAVESGCTPVVFTFRDNPAEHLAGRCRYLTTEDERLRIFEAWGVEYVVMPDFADVAAWPAERFLNLLRFGLHAQALFCGADFRFGKFAAGDTAMLARSCAQRGAELHVVDTVCYQGETVSATRIRSAIERGEMEDAAAMLGRPFGFCFEVVHGNHIGHKIGTPTINQHFPAQFILPRFGVYASAVHINGKVFHGVTNVGVKPTVGSDRALSETWIPGFSGDLYGRTLRLELLGFIRDEKKFSGLDALKEEIKRNEVQAREIFNAYRSKSGKVRKAEDAALKNSAWRVYFGGFWARAKGERAGREIPVEKSFSWGGTWRVPSVYACAKGLVVDFCIEVRPEEVRRYLDKWRPELEKGSARTAEEYERMEAENPLGVRFRAEAELNGRTLVCKSAAQVCWIPEVCRPGDAQPDAEAEAALRHYGLDASLGWVFHRAVFPWKTKPTLRTLKLTLRQEPVFVAGPHFETPGAQRVSLTHPLTGEKHTLTVQEAEPQKADWKDRPFGDGRSFPQHYTALAYTLSPELPDHELSVRDCAESDRPVLTEAPVNPAFPEVQDAACIGVIGGADGPTAIFFTAKKREGGSPKAHTACSALHFKPVERVEWRTAFHVKTLPDITVALNVKPDAGKSEEQ